MADDSDHSDDTTEQLRAEEVRRNRGLFELRLVLGLAIMWVARFALQFEPTLGWAVMAVGLVLAWSALAVPKPR